MDNTLPTALTEDLQILEFFIVIGIKSYKELAAYTSGQILPLGRHSEISKFTSYVKHSLKSGATIAKGTFRTTRQRSVAANEGNFYVDSEVKSIMVTVNSGYAYRVCTHKRCIGCPKT